VRLSKSHAGAAAIFGNEFDAGRLHGNAVHAEAGRRAIP